MRIRVIVFAVAALMPALCRAATCNNSIPDAAAYSILAVTSDVRWGAGLVAGSPVGPGSPYTQANVDLARQYVQEKLKTQDEFSFAYLARVSGRLVTPCAIVEPAPICQRALHSDQCVTLQVRVIALTIPLADAGGRTLSTPRAGTETHLDGVPRPLLAFAPQFGLSNDSAQGAVLSFRSASDLSLLAPLFRGNAIADQPNHSRNQANLEMEGSRSLNASYYGAAAQVSGSRSFPGVFQALAGNVSYRAASTPFGQGRLRANTATAGVAARVTPGYPALQNLFLSADYNHSANHLDAPGNQTGSAENGLLSRIFADGAIGSAPVRTALWFQHNSVASSGSFDKLVIRSAIQESFALKPHQSLGVEVIGGYGRATGVLPARDFCVGGNAGANFLADGAASSSQMTPPGPILRSFGVGQLDWSRALSTTTRQSFAHINLTASIPIGLSQPLIPAFEVLPGETAAQLLEKQVGNNQILKHVLMSQGESEASAEREQDRVMKSIRPAVHFIAEQANIWSVKPLVLFDYVHTSMPMPSSGGMSWLAAGGGLQLTVVTAQLEAGYVRSLPNGSQPTPGNFVFRLTFQNLF